MEHAKERLLLIAVPKSKNAENDLLSARCNLEVEIGEWNRELRRKEGFQLLVFDRGEGHEVPSVEYAETFRFFSFIVSYRTVPTLKEFVKEFISA